MIKGTSTPAVSVYHPPRTYPRLVTTKPSQPGWAGVWLVQEPKFGLYEKAVDLLTGRVVVGLTPAYYEDYRGTVTLGNSD